MSKTFPVHPTKGFDGGKKFKSEAGKRVSAFLKEQQRNNTHSDLKTTVNSQFDTWVVPLVQMFPFGIRQDEFITSELLSNATQDSKLFLASGYFNLTRKYMDILLKSSAKCEILTSHPTVNGFYEAKGVAGKYSCHPCFKQQQQQQQLQKYYLEKTADIWRRYHWFPREMTSERRNCILMTRHFPDLDSASDWLKQISHAAEWSCREGHFLQRIRSTSQICVCTSSVWNFCARFSSVISGGNQWRCRKMSAFSQAKRLITLIGLLGQTFVI